MDKINFTYAQARKLINLSQEKMAKKLRITPPTLSSIETYKTYPSAKVLDDICKMCGISRDQILIDK